MLWDGGIRFIFDHVVPVKGVDFSKKVVDTVVKDLSQLAFSLVCRGTGCRETSAQMTKVLLPASRMLKLGVLRRKVVVAAAFRRCLHVICRHMNQPPFSSGVRDRSVIEQVHQLHNRDKTTRGSDNCAEIADSTMSSCSSGSGRSTDTELESFMSFFV